MNLGAAGFVHGWSDHRLGGRFLAGIRLERLRRLRVGKNHLDGVLRREILPTRRRDFPLRNRRRDRSLARIAWRFSCRWIRWHRACAVLDCGG